jgi:hypothetical protein
MRKTIAVVVLVVVTVLTGAAHATSLTVTEGSVTDYTTDLFARFSGDGFSVLMSAPFGFGAFGGIITIGFGADSGFFRIVVGGLSCVGPPGNCGFVTLTSPHLATPPPDWPHNVNFIVAAPFTATGHLNVGDGFDLVGQGMLEGILCFDFSQSPCNEPGFESGKVSRYTFSATAVPEPSTLLLVVAALGALGALQRSVRRMLRLLTARTW